jgi:eukaryotic-like serine/threonine-protein kinase
MSQCESAGRLKPGTALGRYVVDQLVGAGGMGEVYRARDTRLSRTVAVKTIATALVDDRSAEPQFSRERDIASRLEHPHICRLLDAGHGSGVDYVVFEYLDGETLAARIERGPVPLGEAIGYAIQMADALDYAHQRGIIHRDLKPGNVALTATGVKLLDFGLATQRERRWPGVAVHSGTTVVSAPMAGTILGTTPYVAPERLEGREADHRADIFAFGVVLYEMVAGRRPFDGDSPAAVIAATLAGNPQPLPLSARHEAELEWLVRCCLARRPEDRWHSMADVARVLKRIAADGERARTAPGGRQQRLGAAIAVAVALVLVLGVAAIPSGNASGPGERSVALAVAPPAGGSFTPSAGSVQTSQASVSPTGEQLAYVAAGADGVSQLWLRPLNDVTPRRLAGTEGAMYPFWSPDGRSLGFFRRGTLQRIDLNGGPARTLAPASGGRGGSWNGDGVILFAATATDVIYSVSSDGGTPTPVTRFDTARGDTSHRWPNFLPDGRRFLYFARSEQQAQEGIYLASLDDPAATLVTNSNYGAVYVEPGWVLYLSDGMLLVRALDVERRRTVGDPIIVAEQVRGSSTFYPGISANAHVLAYATSADSAQLDWMDRTGRRESTAVARGRYVDFQISPDGRLLALAEVDTETDRPDIFVLDFERGTRVRVTSARATDASVTWSPDAKRLAFRSNRERSHDLYTRALSTIVPDELFLHSPSAKYPTGWSPDGKLLLYHTLGSRTGWDIWAVPIADSRKTFPLVSTPFNEWDAEVSPDGRWIAYTSDETGSTQVYVQVMGSSSPRWQVSRQSGSQPKWRPYSSELYYMSADGTLMMVPMTSSGGPGVAEPLFRVLNGVPSAARDFDLGSTNYDVAADGRFLVRVPLEDALATSLTVITGWAPRPAR